MRQSEHPGTVGTLAREQAGPARGAGRVGAKCLPEENPVFSELLKVWGWYIKTVRLNVAARVVGMQIEDIAAALDIYLLETGSYPTSSQGLDALVGAPTGVKNWNGPYLRKSTVPVDPWGNPYHYAAPGEHGEFDLYSLGADNSSGGDKENRDIVSWE